MANTPLHSFMCLIIRHQLQFTTIIHFSTISYSSIDKHLSVFQKKGYLNFRKHLSISCSGNFPVRKLIMESFLNTLASLDESFPKSCLEQLFCIELARTCPCKRNYIADVISGVFQSSLFYNASARHKRHECDMSYTSTTRLKNERHKRDKSVTRVLHEQHEYDTSATQRHEYDTSEKIDFDNDRCENIFSHSYIS